MLEGLDIEGKEVKLIRNLDWNQRGAVRVQGERTEYQTIRQGCAISPDLFNLYG